MEASATPTVKPVEADNEENPFEAMMQRFDRAADLLSLDSGIYRILCRKRGAALRGRNLRQLSPAKLPRPETAR